MAESSSSLPASDFSQELASALPALARLTDSDAVVLRLADTAACALGAEAVGTTGEGTIAHMRRYAGPTVGPATIWATGERASVEVAALRNAVAQRYLDFNDTYIGRAVTHPSDMIPALVALAEARKLPWDRLITSVTVAYEVLCRLADQALLGDHGFDGSTLTPIGAVAGASWLVGLDEKRTAEALSIAALDAGTLRAVRQGRLSDWKAIASGRGAAKGLFAVSMVEAGCHAPERVFEGKDGFFNRVSGPLTIGLDGDARLPGTLIKKFPTQIFIQGLIELAQELKARIAAPEDIKAITIGLSRQAVQMLGGAGTTKERINRETADHSAGFAVGAVLLTGRLAHDDYDKLLGDPAVLSLMESVQLEEDPEATRQYPRQLPARMTALLSSGKEITVTQPSPRPMDPISFAQKLDALWPAGRRRDWPWQLPGQAPQFPG